MESLRNLHNPVQFPLCASQCQQAAVNTEDYKGHMVHINMCPVCYLPKEATVTSTL